VTFRHFGGNNPTLGINAEMQFLSAFVQLLTMLLAVLFSLTADL
jgi:hypothetical protein